MRRSSSLRRRPDSALHLDRSVVRLLEDVRVAVLDLDVSPLLGDHVEERPTPQTVCLAYHVQVARGDVTHAALEDTERALSRLVLRERGLDLLADHERHELLPARAAAMSARLTARSGRPARARRAASTRSVGSGPGCNSPRRTSGASGAMPASALSWSVMISTRLASICRLASKRLTSTSCRPSSTEGDAPWPTRLRTRPRASRFTVSRSSVTARLRRAASSSPAYVRTSARRRRSTSATWARLMSSSRSATATRPSFRPLRSSGSERPAVRLLSGDCAVWPPRSSIGFGGRPAWRTRPTAASASARTALRSGLSASARATSSSTVISVAGCAKTRRAPTTTTPVTMTNTACLARMALSHRNRELCRALAQGALPRHRHLPRPPVRELDRAAIAARALGRERRASEHRRHPRHGHAGGERHLASIDRLLVLRRREREDEVVLRWLPLPGLALQRHDHVLDLLRVDRLHVRRRRGLGARDHQTTNCHHHEQSLRHVILLVVVSSPAPSPAGVRGWGDGRVRLAPHAGDPARGARRRSPA